MKTAARRDRAWLLAAAKAVAERLKLSSAGTRLRIRIPSRAGEMNTDGWRAVIGDLGEGQPRLEVWFDRFSGYSERKLWACFHSHVRPQIASITKLVDRKLWPCRVLTMDDVTPDGAFTLVKHLAASEFNRPILEKYRGGQTFYGLYDQTRPTTQRLNSHFTERAAAFFEDVARALPHAKAEDDTREVFPHTEDRKRVASHLHRERSKLLAAECKIRDGYRCRVCGLHFEEVYGELGHEFAEAHHMVPLGQLRDKVRTSLKDLVTVCANCHRMLHRMQGRRDDIKKLRASVRRHRS